MKLYSFMWLFIYRSTFGILRVIRVYFYQLFYWSPCIYDVNIDDQYNHLPNLINVTIYYYKHLLLLHVFLQQMESCMSHSVSHSCTRQAPKPPNYVSICIHSGKASVFYTALPPTQALYAVHWHKLHYILYTYCQYILYTDLRIYY